MEVLLQLPKWLKIFHRCFEGNFLIVFSRWLRVVTVTIDGEYNVEHNEIVKLNRVEVVIKLKTNLIVITNLKKKKNEIRKDLTSWTYLKLFKSFDNYFKISLNSNNSHLFFTHFLSKSIYLSYIYILKSFILSQVKRLSFQLNRHLQLSGLKIHLRVLQEIAFWHSSLKH